MSIAGCMSKNGFTSSQKAEAVRQVKAFIDGGMTRKEAERSVARALLNQSLADRKYLHEAITPKIPKGASNVELTSAVSQEVKGPSKQEQRRQATKQVTVPVPAQKGEVTNGLQDEKQGADQAPQKVAPPPRAQSLAESLGAKVTPLNAQLTAKEKADAARTADEGLGITASDLRKTAEGLTLERAQHSFDTEIDPDGNHILVNAKGKMAAYEDANLGKTKADVVKAVNKIVAEIEARDSGDLTVDRQPDDTEEVPDWKKAWGKVFSPESINPAEITKPSSKGRIVNALNAISPNWQGKVKIFASAAEVPAELQQHFTNPRTAARYVPADGKGGGGFAIMVADRIQQGSEKGVFLHEIGVHAAMPAAVIKRLANDIRAWAKDENRGLLEQMWSNRVVAEVEKNNQDRIARGEPAMTEELRAHEEVALFVQRLSENGIDPVQPEGVSAGLAAWLKDLVAQFRSMLAKALNTSVKLTGQDIVTLANAAAAQVSQQGVMGNKVETFNGEAPASTNRVLRGPSDAEKAAVRAGVEGKSFIAAADWLVANSAFNPTYKEVAIRVGSRLRKLRDAGLKFNDIHVVGLGDDVPVSLARGNAQGLTVTDIGGATDIWLVGDVPGRESGLSYETLLHELVHASLAGTIHLGSYQKIAEGTQVGVHTKKLRDLQNAVVKEARRRIKDGESGKATLDPVEEAMLKGANILKDEHELMAWALTNAEVQRWLETIPYKGSYSMWNRFTEIVRDMLGLPSRADTALSEILQVSSNLLSTPIADIVHIAKTGKRSLTSPEVHEQISASTENPDSPVSKAISKGIKDVLINRTTREAGLGWLSLHGLVDMYAPPESTGWRGALRKLRDKMVTQDGFMNSLKVKSNLIAGQFNEFEKSAANYSDFYSLMLRTTETGVDPRLKLSDKPDSLLLPLKEQNAYKKAVADVEAAQAKSDKFGPEAKQHLDDLADAKRMLAAVEKDYAGVLDKYSKMTPEEQTAFVKTYKDVEAEWRKWGNVAGAKNPKIAHELYNSTERHLKALGQQQIDTLVGSWYDISYSDKFVYPDGTILNDKGDPLSAKQIAAGATGTNVSGKTVPRAANLSEMMHQMRNGYAGKAALEFMTNKVDPTLMRMHQGPYFHMARWGDYWVTYKSGKEMHREHFENKAEWEEAVAHVREMGEKGEIDKETIDAGLKAQETTRAMSMPMLKNMITAAEAQINAQVGVSDETKETQVKLMRDTLARAYIDTLPETSSKTMQQLRRNVKGASIDMKRSFAKRAEAAHINIAMAKHMPEINLITREMELAAKSLGKEGGSTDEIEIARNVVDEIKQRQNDLANQTGGRTWRENLMSLNHFWYLAGNIKYNVANLMQPLQFVGVIGGKFGMVSAGRALAQAYPGAVQIFNEARKVSWTNPHLDFSKHLSDAEAGQKPLGLDLGQWRMLNALNKQGKLDFTLARELGAISDQEAFNEKTFAGRSANNANRVGKALSVAGHHSETINRSATALAAYNLFMEKNAKMADKAKLQESAEAYAQHAVDKTHFDYSGINTARQMGRNGIFGKNTPLVMAFKRFGAQQLELYLDTVRRSFGHDRARRLAERKAQYKNKPKAELDAAIEEFDKVEDQFEKEARAQLRGMLGMTAILAGAMGLPAASVVATLFNGWDDDDEDVRNKWRKYAAEYFGKYGGGIVTNGIFHGAGVDLQSSIGAQDLIPFSRFISDRREFKDKVQGLASDSAGAAAGMVESVIGSAGKAMDGDIGGAMVDALPKAVANILKGAKLGSDGFYRDAKGNKLPGETSDISAVLTMMGFTPSEMEERGAANRYLKSKQYLQGKDLALIHKEYNNARDSKDREGVREAMKELQVYNLEHPDARVPMQSLAKSYLSMRKKQIVAERTGTGILTSARKAREAKNDAGWVNWGNE